MGRVISNCAMTVTYSGWLHLSTINPLSKTYSPRLRNIYLSCQGNVAVWCYQSNTCLLKTCWKYCRRSCLVVKRRSHWLHIWGRDICDGYFCYYLCNEPSSTLRSNLKTVVILSIFQRLSDLPIVSCKLSCRFPRGSCDRRLIVGNPQCGLDIVGSFWFLWV